MFLFLDYDSDPNNFFGSYHGPYYQASADLILNGLRMPSFTITFVFDSTGNLLDSAGGYFGELPNNDTTTHQSLAGLRQSFLNSYKQCVIGGYRAARLRRRQHPKQQHPLGTATGKSLAGVFRR